MSKTIKVKMVNEEGEKRSFKYRQEIKGFKPLGKEIKISPKSNATINAVGYKCEYFVETVSVVIGIGNDHVAELILDVESWEALKSGEEVSITTCKQFKEDFL
jgi:hypothetical protein